MERLFDSPRHAGAGAPVQRRGAPRQTTGLQAIVQRSARLAAQDELAQLVQASPRMQAQERICQMVADSPRMAAQRRETGLPQGSSGIPAGLRRGIHQLSGIDLGGARVHRNSPAPGRIGAHAFAQSGQIHLGPGQERHLPHEAWHLVQQAQGRVRQTMQAKGMAVNDDSTLEREADNMGARADALGRSSAAQLPSGAPAAAAAPVAQAYWMRLQEKPEWINNARKVDAILVPEAPGTEGQSGQDGQRFKFDESSAGSTIYRLSDRIQVPWSEISRLITALGAAKMQAIYVRQFPLWGTEEGVAALRAQLDNLARLDLTVLQSLFANDAAQVSRLLTTATMPDFRRLFEGAREQQLAFARGGFTKVQLPLPPLEEAPGAEDAASEAPQAGHGEGQPGPTKPAGQPPRATPDAAQAPRAAPDRRAVIRSAVAERIAERRPAARGGAAQQLDALAQQWAAGRIGESVAAADAETRRGAGLLGELQMPGAEPSGIFGGVSDRVRLAVSAGPYQGRDAIVRRRPGRAVLRGDYTGSDGRKQPNAVHGRFEGQLSGLAESAEAQPVESVMAKGTGTAHAALDARTAPRGRLAGSMSGAFDMPAAWLTLGTALARFEGSGLLHAPMDGPLHSPDTQWRLGQNQRLDADTGRQVITDGAHNRAVMQPALLHAAGAGGEGQSLHAQMRGTTQGWGHPVRNAGRYSALKVELSDSGAYEVGIFRPDTLHDIVRHAGAAGVPRRYERAPDGSGPPELDGALLARSLAVSGQVEQLAAEGLLTESAAGMARLQLAAGTPELKAASTAPDIAFASTVKAGASYSVTVDRRKYEFKLEQLALPAQWREGSFTYRFRLGDHPLAEYVAEA
ncbi:eCIS core domain-containing protein [Massilia endophytica]|uniref:eCIS core domain-containing protein n=1 Tax=Massilia endophytica TaxID=2899220 RepID=UPI001E2C9A42|nr:DUF4157 domain-containing protein [Massilia endophytica]UGQ48185.1 DUF4157 domain-containing protein [Massilia endophytica]